MNVVNFRWESTALGAAGAKQTTGAARGQPIRVCCARIYHKIIIFLKALRV